MSQPRKGYRLSLILLVVTFLSASGCAKRKIRDSGPRIIPSEHMTDPLDSLPDPVVLPSGTSRSRINAPSTWYPPQSVERRWQAIVVHHSATSYGNMAIFDKWHREGNHWEGVGYDFVIGNGTDSADGQVEVTFRWHQQKTGAHCKTPGNWANENAIGICLVGNFDEAVPSSAQMQSLTKLIHFLSDRYGISAAKIYGHNSTPGARSTNCPGRHFKLSTIRGLLSK